MQVHHQAIIHLAEQRGHLETDWRRSYMTFNCGSYQNEYRKPFGALQVFNEDTLSAGHTLAMKVEGNTDVLLLPLVGTVAYTDSRGHAGYVQAGQMQVCSTSADLEYTIANPFEEDQLVQFLQIHLRRKTGEILFPNRLITFDLTQRNQLLPLITPDDIHQPCSCYLGKYQGRKKGEYGLSNKQHGIYAFVIQGAFELQDILLQPKDGLALWETSLFDFEALSEEAILLLLEVPIQ